MPAGKALCSVVFDHGLIEAAADEATCACATLSSVVLSRGLKLCICAAIPRARLSSFEVFIHGLIEAMCALKRLRAFKRSSVVLSMMRLKPVSEYWRLCSVVLSHGLIEAIANERIASFNAKVDLQRTLQPH